ncbi:MAG: YlbF family regulator [Ruminococcaceae bacterium]|nr:YlbF family regulator [Oscillospiraceae bacterium]
MEKILNEKITEMIHALGKEIKEDPRAGALQTAADIYNDSAELRTLITEYNVHQTALSAEYSKDDQDEDVIRNIEKRLEELYNEITNNDAYVAYTQAKDEYDAYYSEILAELEFAITGHRPCSHDCSSCGGCH